MHLSAILYGKQLFNIMTSLETSQDLNSFSAAKQFLAAMTCLIIFISNVQFWVNYPLCCVLNYSVPYIFRMDGHLNFSYPFLSVFGE